MKAHKKGRTIDQHKPMPLSVVPSYVAAAFDADEISGVHARPKERIPPRKVGFSSPEPKVDGIRMGWLEALRCADKATVKQKAAAAAWLEKFEAYDKPWRNK